MVKYILIIWLNWWYFKLNSLNILCCFCHCYKVKWIYLFFKLNTVGRKDKSCKTFQNDLIFWYFVHQYFWVILLDLVPRKLFVIHFFLHYYDLVASKGKPGNSEEIWEIYVIGSSLWASIGSTSPLRGNFGDSVFFLKAYHVPRNVDCLHFICWGVY